MAEQMPVAAEEQKPKSKLPIKTLLIILGVLLLEGGTIFVFMVSKGGPQPAEATDPVAETEETQNNLLAEVSLVEDFSVDNYVGGKTRIVVTMEISAKVEKSNQEKLQLLVDENKKEIMDSIRTLVASAQPDQIKDPKKQVMKREIKIGVEKIIGEGLIERILTPAWQSYPTD